MTNVMLLSTLLLMTIAARGQGNPAPPDLPVNIVNSTADKSKPLIIYISGDGGWNSFSQGFTKQLASSGYPVVSLNANKYFWKKKTPAQAAADVTLLMNEYCRLWDRATVSIIGYSFGADVTPFVYNRLAPGVAA
ncbi:MAG: AcvB/VirJ family lysyl-phosphatidylglycerol hydrolase, partial [Chitinophagaceae bacterium]